MIDFQSLDPELVKGEGFFLWESSVCLSLKARGTLLTVPSGNLATRCQLASNILRMGAYVPLHNWLAGQPLAVNNVPVTFEQIERILGFQLPATARRKAQWWENNATRHIQARSWLDAGFVTQDVNIPNETLTFARG